MALILNIDTSSDICSVCLAEDGQMIEQRNETAENRHASMLTIQIREMLADHHIGMKDLSAVALSSGPGSYTGLRIGTSVAKGICYGLNKPLISVSTLRGIADQMARLKPDPNGIYVSMLDARRGNVYMAVYDEQNKVLVKDVFVSSSVDFKVIISTYSVKNVYFGGSGAEKSEIICLNNEFGIIIENLTCVASNIRDISYDCFRQYMFEDVTYFEPFYLKEFEGYIKIK